MLIPYLTKLTQQASLRYVFIGVITVALDFATFTLLVLIGVNYFVAENLNTPLLLLFNFFAHKVFTFQQRHSRTRPQIVRYGIAVVVQYVLALLILVGLVEGFNLDPIISKVVQLVLLPLVNFLVLKRFVFKN